MTNRREHWPALKDGLMLLFDLLSPRLDRKDSAIVEEFLDNQEFGLALEWMYCATIELSKSEREHCDRLARLMDMSLN
jgi:hypothetical protein